MVAPNLLAHVVFVCRGWGHTATEARWLGFPRPPVQWVMVSCPGLLGAADSVLGEEGLTGGSQGLVLCAHLFCCQHLLLSGPWFIFSRKRMTVLTLWDYRGPVKEKKKSVLHGRLRMGSPELSAEPHAFCWGEWSRQHLFSWDLPLPLLWTLTSGYHFLATLWSPSWSPVMTPNYGSLVLVTPLGDVLVLVV